LYERALAICEQVLGPNHPDTARSLNNLAFLYQSQGDYEHAKPLYERALAIMERTLGSNHPDTKIVRRNHAMLLEDMEQKEKK
jgi:tetratricopeptide (TPR) repeat protein